MTTARLTVRFLLAAPIGSIAVVLNVHLVFFILWAQRLASPDSRTLRSALREANNVAATAGVLSLLVLVAIGTPLGITLVRLGCTSALQFAGVGTLVMALPSFAYHLTFGTAGGSEPLGTVDAKELLYFLLFTTSGATAAVADWAVVLSKPATKFWNARDRRRSKDRGSRLFP